MGKALLLSGKKETSRWLDGDDLDTLQQAVGESPNNSIEGLHLAKYWTMYVNEEGFILQLPQNEAAAYCLSEMTNRNELIWGPAVVVFEGKGKAAKDEKDKFTKWFDEYKSGALEKRLFGEEAGEIPPITEDELAEFLAEQGIEPKKDAKAPKRKGNDKQEDAKKTPKRQKKKSTLKKT